MLLQVVSEYQEKKTLRLPSGHVVKKSLPIFLFVSTQKWDGQKETSRARIHLTARAAIQRHLCVLRRPLNIFSDDSFAHANNVLDSVSQAHKKASIEQQVKRKEALPEEDSAKVTGEDLAKVMEEDTAKVIPYLK